MKYLLLILICLISLRASSQNVQLVYDMRHTTDPKNNSGNFPTLYFEYFKQQDSGRSFINRVLSYSKCRPMRRDREPIPVKCISRWPKHFAAGSRPYSCTFRLAGAWVLPSRNNTVIIFLQPMPPASHGPFNGRAVIIVWCWIINMYHTLNPALIFYGPSIFTRGYSNIVVNCSEIFHFGLKKKSWRCDDPESKRQEIFPVWRTPILVSLCWVACQWEHG